MVQRSTAALLASIPPPTSTPSQHTSLTTATAEKRSGGAPSSLTALVTGGNTSATVPSGVGGTAGSSGSGGSGGVALERAILEIEGPPSEEYYRVRAVLYNVYAMV